MTQGASFKEFYLDENLPGHSLLEPSIWVGKACGRVFSPIKESGCEFFSEVITRAALLVILPLGALFSTFLIPFGLAAKGLGLCCVPETDSFSLPNPSRPQNSDNGTRFPTPGRFVKKRNDAILNPTDQDEESIRREMAIKEMVINDFQNRFRMIRSRLEIIKSKRINPEELASIKQSLKRIFDDFAAFEVTKTLKEEYQNLICWVDALQFKYDYFGKTRLGIDSSTVAGGEISVADNGDCLFEASNCLSELNDSIRQYSPEEERRETVEWMRSNYNTDKELQRHLVSSMIEHFLAKIERLEDEQRGLLLIGKTEESSRRLGEIENELNNFYHNYIPAFQKANGNAHQDDFNFDPVRRYVDEYFIEMSKQGVHGGIAELYALSQRHKVCYKIHGKREMGGRVVVDAEPYCTINRQFDTEQHPARHFTHTRNHYNPYLPT